MRERFDFASISEILLAGLKEDSINQEQYYEMVFDYAFSQDEMKVAKLDVGNTSKTIHGIRSVPKPIIYLYQNPIGVHSLKESVAKILKELSDISYTKSQIYDLMMSDPSLSLDKKRELSDYENDTVAFVAHCLLEGFTRPHIKRIKNGEKYIPVQDFLLSDFLLDYHSPRMGEVFKGRDTELETIHNRLKQDRILFLNGIGAIGKSELAKQYGKLHKDDYEHILYLQYNEDLRQTICNMSFVDDTPDMDQNKLFKMHFDFFKRLGKNTLVILDNFNTVPEQDELFDMFLSFAFHLLVTTRSKIADVSCYAVEEIQSMDALSEIFYSHAPKSKETPEIVREIIAEVYRHTLTVEIAAKTMGAADLSTEQLLNALQNEKLYLNSPNKVSIKKDARTKKATPKDHLMRLFEISRLSEAKQLDLRHLLLIPSAGIQKSLFRKWTGESDFNSINDLIEYGWVYEDETTSRISMHPFLSEIVESFDKPSFKKCQGFIERLGQEYVVHVDDEINYRDLLGLTKSIIKRVTVDDPSLAFGLFEKILIYLERYMYHNTMNDILNLMEQTISLDENHKKEMGTYHFYRGVVIAGRGEFDLAIDYLKKSVAILEPFGEENLKVSIDALNQLGYYSMLKNDAKQFKYCMDKIVWLRQEYDFAEPLEHELSEVNQMLANAMNSAESGALELDTLLEKPEISSYMKEAKERGAFDNMKTDEFKQHLEKVVSEELSGDIAPFYQEVKSSLEDLASEKQDEISFFDLLESICDVVQKHSE